MSGIKERYHRDGYLVIGGCLDPEILNAVMLQMYALLVQQLKIRNIPCAEDVTKNLKALLDVDEEIYFSTLRLCAKLASLQAVFLHNNIRTVAGHLGVIFQTIPSPPVMHVMSDLLRVEGGYHGTGAHQDWPSLQGSLDMINVWIPFTEASKDSFALEVIPGSHKNGLLAGRTNGSVLESYGHENNFIPLECKPGDVVFMSGFTVHRTGKGNNVLRIAASMRYDNADELSFIERGYPCAQKRVTDYGLITPGFPSIDQLEKVFQ